MYQFPQDYRAFRPNRLVRPKPLEDAIVRHGRTHTIRPKGLELVRYCVAKMAEEHEEARAALQAWQINPCEDMRNHVLEELADIHEYACFTNKNIRMPSPMSRLSSLSLYDMCRQWQGLQKTAADQRQYTEHLGCQVAELLTATRASMENVLPLFPSGIKSVENAQREKNSRKGKPDGRVLVYIALPRDDEWVAAFAAKDEEVNPATIAEFAEAVAC